MATIFDLIDFEPNRHLTIRIKPRSGDLVMMRRQLLNLKELAESSR